jgi:hypothetical protein
MQTRSRVALRFRPRVARQTDNRNEANNSFQHCDVSQQDARRANALQSCLHGIITYLSVITLSMVMRMLIEPMATKKSIVLVRFQPEIKDALNDAASKDGRSLSGLLEKIAVEWLRSNGRPEIHLKGPKKRGEQ